MITIQEDPKLVVPSINEKFANNKLILIYLKSINSSSNKYAGILQNDIPYKWKGGSPSCCSDICTWSPRGLTLLELFIDTWDLYTSCELEIIIYILSDSKEFQEICHRHNITNMALIQYAKDICGRISHDCNR